MEEEEEGGVSGSAPSGGHVSAGGGRGGDVGAVGGGWRQERPQRLSQESAEGAQSGELHHLSS